MKSLQMLSFKGLTFILFYLFVLIENSDSVSYTIGNYPSYYKFGVNDEECGVSTNNYLNVELPIDYLDHHGHCFKTRFKRQKLVVKNEDIFHSFKPKQRIFGGTLTEDMTAPWAVLIYYLNTTNHKTVICEGVLITLQWVLTMARCNPKSENNRQIYAGSHIALKGVERQSILWIPAKIFKRELVHWDLALVKLNEPYDRTLDSKFNMKYTLNTVCLPKRDEVNSGPENAEFFSWGDVTENRSRSTYLRRADIPLVGSSKGCGHPHLLCANFIKGSDSPRPCYADRGAGLIQYNKGKAKGVAVRKAVLAGIFLGTEANVTYKPLHTEPCTQDITYAEFYRVSDVISWILNNIRKN